MTEDAAPIGPPEGILEVGDATAFLDVIKSYELTGPQTMVEMPQGSAILCAKAMPNGTLQLFARATIDPDAPTCPIGVWVFATGQPVPAGDDMITYLDTVVQVRQSAVITRDRPATIHVFHVFHVFLITESLVEGNVKIAV